MNLGWCLYGKIMKLLATDVATSIQCCGFTTTSSMHCILKNDPYSNNLGKIRILPMVKNDDESHFMPP